jgi:flagellar motor switch/type III secretory pathway protein FliN
VRAARRTRAAFAPGARREALARALGDVLTSDVAIVVRTIEPSAFEGVRHGIHLETADGAGRLVVEPEPGLATAALARLLGRVVPLTDPYAPLDATLTGALAAICVETMRRSGATLPLRATSDSPGVPLVPSEGLRLDATVSLDGKPYSVSLWLFSDARPTSGAPAPDLALLGDLPITLRVVAAVSEGTRADLECLRPGDVWLPGGGWLHRDLGAGGGEAPALTVLRRAALASPTLDRGVETGCSDDGRIVVRADVIALAAAEGRASVGEERNGAMSEPNETLRDIALDAPVLVRVEVASVTLTAREWAGLGPGDVIETGVRLAEPVVLRVAGREVARGELVSVDGELGVRVLEIIDPGRSP